MRHRIRLLVTRAATFAGLTTALVFAHQWQYHGWRFQSLDYGDPVSYQQAASRPVADILRAHHQPLLPLEIKLLRRAFGADWLGAFALLQKAGLIASAACVGWLVHRTTKSRPWAMAAALLVLLDVRLGLYQYWLLTEISSTLLSLVSCALLVVHFDRPRLATGMLGGLVLFVLTLARSQNLAFVVVALPLAIAGSGRWQDRARRALPVGLALALAAGHHAFQFLEDGHPFSQTGQNLYAFVIQRPEAIAALPATTEDVAHFASHFRAADPVTRPVQILPDDLQLVEAFGGWWSPKFSAATRSVYLAVLVRHPTAILATAWESFVLHESSEGVPPAVDGRPSAAQPRRVIVPPYPEDRNAQQLLSRSLDGHLASAVFTPVTNMATTLLSIAAFLHAATLRRRVSSSLAVLGAWVIVNVMVTSFLSFPTWYADGMRMRLSYEPHVLAMTAMVLPTALAALLERTRRARGAGSSPPDAHQRAVRP